MFFVKLIQKSTVDQQSTLT